MNTFFVHSPLGITMVNIQDARHPNQTADKKFYEYINNFTFEIIVALNKVDKLKKQKEKAALKKQMPELIKEYKYVKQVHFVSAESKQGIDDLESSLINLILEKTAKLSVDE
jgi:GTP-binding protein